MTDKIATRFGPYRLLHQLGAGGMGQVFLATHEGEHGISRLVAIKRILAHLAADEKLVQLFLDEVRIAAQINHSNVVQVIDHGAIEGRYYMAMEYIHGENLADVLERLHSRNERMPVDIALHIASSVCEGLDHAHRKTSLDGKPLGIVHRDISPHNVMLSFQGEVKIADFGIARAAEQRHETLGGELRGKISYMSPEQAYGKALDRRSDLFSLGLVLYEVFTGVNPVARGAPLATLEAVRAVDIVPLAVARPDLPPELHELIAQVLSPDPEARPDSARTFHEGLQRVMRMNNLVASPFDLADYLYDLFPEASDETIDDLSKERADAGHRADALSSAHDENVSPDEVHRSLLYQRQRRPGGGSLLLDLPPDLLVPSSDATAASTHAHAQRRLPAWLIAILAAILAGGGVALFTHLGTRSTGRTDPHPRSGRPRTAPNRTARLALSPPRHDTSRSLDARIAKDLGVGETSAPPRARGRLRLLSVPPRARVSLDGRPLSRRTPLTLSALPGKHHIALTLDGYLPTHRTINIQPGSNPTLTLRPKARPARLELCATHACALTIDGHAAGHLAPSQGPPGKIFQHRAGPLRLTCRHVSGATYRRVLRLAPGKRRTLTLAFGNLTVNLQPWAKVHVDGHSRGDTPLRLLLPAGRHTLRLDNPAAHRHRTRTITIRPRATTRIATW